MIRVLHVARLCRLAVMTIAWGFLIAPSVAQTLTLQLPLSRFSHGFALHYWEAATGMEYVLSPDSALLSPAGTVEGNGQYQLAAGSYLELTIALDTSLVSQWYLSDTTSAEGSPWGVGDLRATLWGFDAPYSPSTEPSALRYFALPINRYQHALTVIDENGTRFVVTQSPEEGQTVPDPNSGDPTFQGFGFFTAQADLTGAVGNFSMVDLSSAQQANWGGTDLLGSAWGSLSVPSVVRSATILVGGQNTGLYFTFHTSAGTLQSALPVWGQWSDPSTGVSYTGYGVSGAVGIGSSFWLTRDIDGLESVHRQMLVSNQVQDWSAGIPVVAGRTMQSGSFRIGQNRSGHIVALHHPDGFVRYLYIAPWNSYNSNSLISYDANGTTFAYYYTDFLADVDVNQTWVLFDETTGENLGTSGSNMDGYMPYAPARSVLISSTRRGHTLMLHQADGTTFELAPVPGYAASDTDLSVWNLYFSGGMDEHYYEIRYFPMSAPLDTAQTITIEDQTAGDEIQGTVTWNEGVPFVDLSQWYPPATPLNLTIAGSRWTHQLSLHQPNGESFPLTKGNAQGVWAQDAQQQSWFISYGYFDASSNHHPELGWWIYDATTGEVSDSQTDLTQWASAVDSNDSDGDGLADWYEFVLGTSPTNGDTDGDGILDGYEVRYGLNPNDASDASLLAIGQGGLTNLQVYQGYQLYTFKLPLGRAGHAFTLHASNGGTAYLPNTTLVTPVAGVDASGRFAMAAGSHLEMTFCNLAVEMTDWWLSDDTSGESSQVNTFDLRTTPWAVNQPYILGGNAPVSSIQHLVIPLSRAQDVFNVIFDNVNFDGGPTYLVTVDSEIAGNAINPATGEMEYRSYGFTTAGSYPEDVPGGFHVLDLTTFEQAPANAIDLLGVAWAAINLPTITRAASIELAEFNSGYEFTFHTSSGSLQGVSVGSCTFWDNGGVSVYNGAGLSASVGIGELFWITRNVDGATSPEMRMGVDNALVDWTGAFAPVRQTQTMTFQIGANRRGNMFVVEQPDGYVADLSLTSQNNILTSWDDNGHAVEYQYDLYSAQVDVNQDWQLVDRTKPENLGNSTSVLDGWSAWHHVAPAGFVALNISQGRRGHELQLRQDDGTTWNVQPTSDFESPDAFVQSWNTCFAGTPAARTAAIDYFLAQAPYDFNQGFTIVDLDTGEEQSFGSNLDFADLSSWSGAAQPLTINVTVTRWTHELQLMQADGSVHAISRGNLQGAWTPTINNQGWFTTYNYFDAATELKPAMEWWIYDVTAQEVADSNQADLTGWIGPSAEWDADGDELPDWYEFIIGTSEHAWDSDGDGIPDGWEVRYGLNPNDGGDANALSQAGEMTNREKYLSGLNPTLADTDGDGMSDFWEIARGLNPLDPSDAFVLDADGVRSNLQVFQGYQILEVQLPLGRTGHALVVNCPKISGGQNTIGAACARPTPMSPTQEGQWQLEDGSYLQALFIYQPSNDQVQNAVLFDSTTGERAPAPNTTGSVDLRDANWTPEGGNLASRCFTLPLNRQAHNLTLVRPDGTLSSITLMNEQGDFGDVFRIYGFFTGIAHPGDDEGDYYVVDEETLEQAPANVTDLRNATWIPLNLPQVVRTVYIRLAESDLGFAFSLHTSAGTLQGVYPLAMTVVNPVTTEVVTGYFISGSVGLGLDFCVSRDADLATSPNQRLPLTGLLVDLSHQFVPIRNEQTLTFRIGGTRATHPLSVHHARDDSSSALTNATWAQLTTWDDDGQPITYDFYGYQAVVDTNQHWTLRDDLTGEDLGSVTDLLEGWMPWHPAPPAGYASVILPYARRGHVIRVRQSDGTTWNVQPAAGYEDPSGHESVTLTYFNGESDERTVDIPYYPAVVPYDPALGYTIVDETAMEERTIGANTPEVDLSQCFSDPKPLMLNISVTRWTHELILHQANGETFPIARGYIQGTLQGIWSPDAQNRPWFTTYSYFDAPTQFHFEHEWWVYDVDTGETSPSNTADLSTWLGSDVALDSDGDGIPDWYEFLFSTDKNNPDTDGDGIPDGWEIQYGLNPRDVTDAGLLSGLGTLTNLQKYQLSISTDTLDSDGDGVPDAAEILAGTDPFKKDDPVIKLKTFWYVAP